MNQAVGTLKQKIMLSCRELFLPFTIKLFLLKNL